MKKKGLQIRTSQEDDAILQRATEKLEKETGSKPMKSRAILTALEEYANAEPELFFCNRVAIEETEKHIETGRQLLQNVYDEFKAVTSFVLTFEQLQTVMEGVVAMGSLNILREAIDNMVTRLLFAKWQEKNPELNYSIDLVKLPDTSSILDAATSLMLPSIGWNLNIGLFWQVYQIADGKIIVNQSEVDKLCEAYRIYAVTSEEKTKLNKVRKLCRQLDYFIKDVSSPEKIPLVCYFDRISGRHEPSEMYVKYKI